MAMSIPQGDTLVFSVDVVGEIDPVDLTGATIACHVYARLSTPLLVLTVGDGITVDTPVQVGEAPAVYSVTLTAEQTAGLSVAVLTVESKVRWPDGTVDQASHDQLVVTASSIGALAP